MLWISQTLRHGRCLLTLTRLFSSADKFCQLFVWTQIRPDRTSILIWIQTVWQPASVPERFFWKTYLKKNISANDQSGQIWTETFWDTDGICEIIFWKKSADYKKACKITQHVKSWSIICHVTTKTLLTTSRVFSLVYQHWWFKKRLQYEKKIFIFQHMEDSRLLFNPKIHNSKHAILTISTCPL